ncbi:MAG: hypothetical protein GXP36_12355 [Actinobacteria bacterium]|nr:hypothetical protein [Actinomycetota bacterium]
MTHENEHENDHEDHLAPAYVALDEAEVALADLEARCCKPERSPRMQALADTLAEVRSGLENVNSDHAAADQVYDTLGDAGSQIGWLQVGCCAPNRLPLYHTLLENLTVTQRAVKKATGGGH